MEYQRKRKRRKTKSRTISGLRMPIEFKKLVEYNARVRGISTQDVLRNLARGGTL
jgi:hypothetical protein|tara:strand:- start:1365 stop:1529 length:165 start_codon:yes stop_codon:yes gene_type:complete